MNRRLIHLSVITLVAVFSSSLFAGAVGLETDTQPLWKVAIIADTQTSQREWITSILGRLKRTEPQMAIHLGDTDFRWGNWFTLKAVADLVRTDTGGIEFHLAPGNHDMSNGRLKAHLRQASTQGIFRLETAPTFAGQGYLHDRVSEYLQGPLWPAWNPEIADHPAWQANKEKGFAAFVLPSKTCRYVFKRGSIRFIVCDWSYSSEQRQWIRDIITQPDDSSVTIVLHHAHQVGKLARYFEGLEGQHNVKLVLSGHDHRFGYETRGQITYIGVAGIAHGRGRDCDGLVLNVYRDTLRLDRYIIPKGSRLPIVLGPEPIWACRGDFSEYVGPEPRRSAPSLLVRSQGAGPSGFNLKRNGYSWDGVFYERAK